jgi:hypothetical protein
LSTLQNLETDISAEIKILATAIKNGLYSSESHLKSLAHRILELLEGKTAVTPVATELPAAVTPEAPAVTETVTEPAAQSAPETEAAPAEEVPVVSSATTTPTAS